MLRHAADVVCVVRLLCGPLVALALCSSPDTHIFTAILLVMSDAIDGPLARRFGSNPWGASLDAAVDKILLLFLQASASFHDALPFWLTVVVTWREMFVTLMRMTAAKHSITFETRQFGKMKSAVLPCSLLAAYLESVVAPLHRGAITIQLVMPLLALVYGLHGWSRGVRGLALVAPVAGGLFCALPFFLSVRSSIIAIQIYFVYGSLAEYVAKAPFVFSKWRQGERLRGKALTFAFATLPFAVALWLYTPGSVRGVFLPTYVLAGVIFVCFVVDASHAVRAKQS